MPITITPQAEGATLSVRTQPGARRNAVLGEHAGALKVAVTAPPVDGRANVALVEVLGEWLGLRKSQIELATGASTRTKVFLIRGVTAEQLAQIIASKLN